MSHVNHIISTKKPWWRWFNYTSTQPSCWDLLILTLTLTLTQSTWSRPFTDEGLKSPLSAKKKKDYYLTVSLCLTWGYVSVYMSMILWHHNTFESQGPVCNLHKYGVGTKSSHTEWSCGLVILCERCMLCHAKVPITTRSKFFQQEANAWSWHWMERSKR